MRTATLLASGLVFLTPLALAAQTPPSDKPKKDSAATTPAPVGLTAKQALAVAAQSGGDTLKQAIVFMKGRWGFPNPIRWEIGVRDDLAGSKLKLFVVEKGQLLSIGRVARPKDVPTTQTIPSGDLKVNSDAAFKISDYEAAQAKIVFDHVHCDLAMGAAGGAPLWVMSLFNSNNFQVGGLTISAKTGKVIDAKWFSDPATKTQGPPPTKKTGGTEPFGSTPPS